eukprot:246530-Prorocentrum_minimum.AAC.1
MEEEEEMGEKAARESGKEDEEMDEAEDGEEDGGADDMEEDEKSMNGDEEDGSAFSWGKSVQRRNVRSAGPRRAVVNSRWGVALD